MSSGAAARRADCCINELCERASDEVPPLLQRCWCGAGFCGEDCWVIAWHFGHRESCSHARGILAAVSAAQPLPTVGDIPKTGSLRERANRSVQDTASLMANIALRQQPQGSQPQHESSVETGFLTSDRKQAPSPPQVLERQQGEREVLLGNTAASGQTGESPAIFFIHSDVLLGQKLEATTVDESVDMMDVLLDMGFDHTDALDALKRCSSMEAAVEFLMLHGTGRRPAEAGNVVKQLDHAGQVALGTLSQPWWASMGNENEGPGTEVVSALLALGFTKEQAQAAARRCSSVEAAVEWLSLHPEPHTWRHLRT